VIEQLRTRENKQIMSIQERSKNFVLKLKYEEGISCYWDSNRKAIVITSEEVDPKILWKRNQDFKFIQE
jgi:hypothetical protein